MTPPSRDQILAASAGWVAVLLNVVPGLGGGVPLSTPLAGVLDHLRVGHSLVRGGCLLAQTADASAEMQNQLVGLISLLLLAAITATEAGLAVKRARSSQTEQSLVAACPSKVTFEFNGSIGSPCFDETVATKTQPFSYRPNSLPNT